MRISDTGQAAPVLQIKDLTVDVETPAGPVRLLDNFSLDLAAGQRVAVVGESGSGKSVMARSILQLDDDFELGGSIRVAGRELLGLTDAQMQSVRGSQVSMVFQDPLSALNPLQTIGEQVMEPLRVRGTSAAEAHRRAVELLSDLGVTRTVERMNSYPHEFSGGMRQRVVLAMALISDPQLLIADEPTTALDVRVQQQVMDLLYEIAEERGLAVILITHDLGIVAGFAERVVVMYSGRKVQEDGVAGTYAQPAHPYTAGLIQAVPRLDQRTKQLLVIPGSPPSPAARPSGCSYHPRCPARMDICETARPNLLPVAGRPECSVACHLFSASEGSRS